MQNLRHNLIRDVLHQLEHTSPQGARCFARKEHFPSARRGRFFIKSAIFSLLFYDILMMRDIGEGNFRLMGRGEALNE
ncbi:hypothetical protein [Thermaerobacillus caldiproteolyticus]|uniref:hypothetical protein n=1 Tax=Thermaerobacillus caldiproteolyticus TaxID=247480 RepID=UPI0018F2292C|nr:hypothetical protein [Anoxybacillus caldiproteolyticus]